MAKFQFKLQTLLNHRQRIEEQRQSELAQAYRQLEQQQGVIEGLRGRLDYYQGQYEVRPGGSIDINQRALLHNYICRTVEEISKQETVLADIRAAVEAKRANLEAALKDRKVLEKLKERDLRTYAQDLMRREQLSLDEIVVQQVAAKRR